MQLMQYFELTRTTEFSPDGDLTVHVVFIPSIKFIEEASIQKLA